MPECVEVALQAEKIQFFSQKTSKLIVSIYWKEKYFEKKIKGTDLVVLPLKFKNVFSRGKLIIFELEDGKNEKIFLVSHLGMSGYWTEEKDQYTKFWINFGDYFSKTDYKTTSTIYFSDIRMIGSSLSFTQDLKDFIKKNGPCLLIASKIKYGLVKSENLNEYQVEATLEKWLKCLSNKRIENKPISEFLLEQKYLSGIGNYIRAELMYSSKIDPRRKLKDLTIKDKELLYEKSLKIIYKSYISKGPSKGYIPEGSFKLKVYMQEFDPLGNKVVRYQDSKKRTVHFVPEIQL